MAKKQISDKALEKLEKQQYRIVGEHHHTAVKTCHWTKAMIKAEGGCYKLSFYGIMSNQCMQMTSSISCANRCSFCWRDYKAPVSKEWEWGVDEPEEMIEGSMEKHHDLLAGLKGYEGTNQANYKLSKDIKHVALSLTGEPITYPKMNELIDGFHSRGISTFLVTNAQYPEAIKNLKPITQLYISLDASSKAMLKEVDRPLFRDYWERLNKSLEYMAEKKGRTTIRLTVVKGYNDEDIKGYADLIRKANPDFLEIKAYMFVGASRQRLKIENMPMYEDVVKFSRDLAKELEDYDLVSEHIPSRVVLMAQKKFYKDGRWMTWIDFDKFAELVNQGKDPMPAEFLRPTPRTGISGKTTKDYFEEKNMVED